MLRNKEYVIWLVVSVLIGSCGVVAVSFYSNNAAVWTAITVGLLVGSYSIFTRWRYKQIRLLSEFLQQIRNGNYSLDVRDHREGELSILKSDIYKMSALLSEHNEQLQIEKQKLTEAISDISHQLKTPLTSMMMMSELVADDQLPHEKRQQFAGQITAQLERIDWLVSSLLKLSKIDSGTIVFKKETIAVEQLVQQALDPIRITSELKQQTITMTGDPTLMIVCDSNWTKEALLNIVKNNVEHTPVGGQIAIRYGENPLYVEIVIEDNGVGMAKSELPYLFKRFFRGRQASENSVGIGLSMSHSIVTSQRGVIDVYSEAGKGTTFHLKFYKQHE
ncbi:sensor histidine kinase [Paenibacillus yanchengensis]|uniref:histidine kinase n=1 Tax=Paenibacillus yanchengensis TaxID=2035833 RepID=A0ABW4YI10_9BACL